MKTVAYTAIKNIAKDRAALLGLVTLIVVGLLTVILLALRIQPSELQVSIQYTSFGGENIYRSRWYYLISFVAFGAIIVALHAAIFTKIYGLKGRAMALLFGYSSVGILVIAFVLLSRVMGIASLT